MKVYGGKQFLGNIEIFNESLYKTLDRGECLILSPLFDADGNASALNVDLFPPSRMTKSTLEIYKTMDENQSKLVQLLLKSIISKGN